MADFDPDAYLGSAPSGGGGFDPDAYLGGAKPAEKAVPEGRNFFTPRTGGEELATQPHDTSIYGTAVPKRADTFSGRVQENFGRAWEKVKEAAKGAYGIDRDLRQFDPAGPVKTAGNLLSLANEATGLVTAIPHAAADPTVEKYTGIPGEEVSGALGAAGARGLRAPIAGRPPEPPRPSAPSALSPEFRAGREAELNPPPPTEGPQGPTVAQPRAGLEPDVRLLPPDLPVNQPVRDSVGAARATSALEQASPEAVRILEGIARDEGWTEHTLDQLEGEQSPHHFLAESSENMEQLAKANQTLPGAARTETNQAVQQRHRERGERVNAIHDEYLGQDVDRTTWDAAMKRAAQQESAPFWQRFDQQVIAPTPEIEAVLQRPGMRRALAAANDTLLNRGLPIEQGFPFLGEEEAASFGDNAGRATAERDAAQTRVPTARAFQLAKMQLDKRIADAVRGGHSTDIRTYTTLKHDLDAAIAAHPNQEVSQLWQQARRTYRGPMSLINAREIGEGLLSGKTHYTEVPGILEDMSPEQRAALQLGLRNHMADVAGRPGASAQLRNIREMLGPDNQRKLAAVIGPERTESYVGALQQEEHMHFAPGRLTKGSDTAANLAFQKLLQPPETRTTLSRAAGVAGDLLHPKAAALRKGMEMLEAGNEAAAGREMQRWQGIRADLGRLLTTQGPERDAIRRALVQRIQEGEGGLAGPVGRQPLTSEVLERGRSGRPIKRTPLPIGTENEILERGARKVEEGPAPGEQQPPQRQGMSFGDMKRRDFLKGMASTLAAANPELGKIAAGISKSEGMKPRLEDAGYGRSLARQAAYMFGDDKGKAADYLFDQLKHSRPGSVVEKANRDALRHITSGDIDKEPGIWAKSIAEMRKHDDTIRAAQSARRAGEEGLRGRGELPGGEGELEAHGGADQEAGRATPEGEPEPPLAPTGLSAAELKAMGHTTFYHGTHPDNVASIKKNGIREARPGEGVSLSTNPLQARRWAQMKYPDAEKLALVETKLDEATRNIKGGSRGSWDDEYRHIGDIPSKFIQGISKHNPEAVPEPPLESLPRKVSVPGVGKLNVGPHQPIRDLARQYAADAGLPYDPPREYAKVDPDRAARIADEYEKMAHAPDDPEVKAAYDAMAKETMAQWQAIKKSGFKAEFIPPDSPNPYAASPRLAVEDIKNNNHMWVYSTRDGFGTLEAFDPSTNPLLAQTGEVISGQPALVNDIFRIVHDYFGHAKEGVGFRADGEENAWRSHAAMYSPLARKAMTSETRGQNSWLNYGPYGEANRTAKTEKTVFADQKTGILPDWVVNEGSGQEGKPIHQPLTRDVTERGRSGRPTKTTPLETGREADVLRSAYNKATGENPARINQRLVTSKKAEPSLEPLKVDMAAARETPEAYQHNVELLRPLLPRKFRNAPTEKVAQAFVDHVADNLKWLHDQVPPEIRDRSKLWYDGGRNIVDQWVKDYGIKDSAAAGVLAALSPQKDWFQNVSLAGRVLEINRGGGKNFYNGFKTSPEMHAAFEGRPTLKDYQPLLDKIAGKSLGDIDALDIPKGDRVALKALWTRLYDEAHHLPQHSIITPEGGAGELARSKGGEPKKISWGSFDQIGNAIEAIDANGNPAVLDKTMGDKHKVRNFYNNLLNPNSKMGDVTIDTHAVAAGLLKPLGGNSTEVLHNFNSSLMKEKQKPDFVGARGSALTGVQGTYPFYADAYRKAAEKVGILPREMQSITWEAIRGLFEASQKKNLKGAIDNIWRQYRSGRLSLDDARQQVLKEAGGIRNPDWFGDRTAAPHGGETANEAQLSKSSVSRRPAEAARRRGGGEPAEEIARADGGRVAAPLSARKTHHYAHNRGTEKEHCSNCSMFRTPHGCTAVGGFIARMGKCDIWEVARKQRADGGGAFRDRLPEAEGQIEDRRDDPPMPEMSRLHGVMTRLGLPAPKPTPMQGSGIAGRLQFDAGINDLRRPHRDAGGPISSTISGFPSLAGPPGSGIAPMPEWGWNSQQPMAQPKSPTIESGFSFGGNHALTAESMEPSASSTAFKSGFSMLPSGGKGK